MHNQASLQETKQHGAVRFPFNLYPCTIPGDFPQVALHWQESMELVFVKRGAGLVQVGTASCPAYQGDIFIFTPGTLHALRQAEGQRMEYENIIFELELLGGAEDLCAEKYLLPLQSGRLLLPACGRWRKPTAPSSPATSCWSRGRCCASFPCSLRRGSSSSPRKQPTPSG